MSRWVFNWTIDFIRSCRNFTPGWMEIKKYATQLLPEWTKSTPFQIKGIAIKEACEAFWKAKGRPSFRSRKDSTQSCFIPKPAISDKGIYPRVSGKGLKFKEGIPVNILDGRLVKRYDQWFLSAPHKKTVHAPENQGAGIVALDPGVRSFQTFYSETSAGHLGTGDMGRIMRLCFYLDDLISRTSKASKYRALAMKRAQNRMRLKIKNLIKEAHCKIAKFLVNNFDIILLPTFETSQMALKQTRKIRAKSVRQMLTWAHYAFKLRLQNKAFEFGKKVIEVCEAYTTKTVSWNGKILNVGGSKTITSDGLSMDRDRNGARNIFLRALVDSPILEKLRVQS